MRYHRLVFDRHTILCERSHLDIVGLFCSVILADMYLTNQSCWTQFHFLMWQIYIYLQCLGCLERPDSLPCTLKSTQMRILASFLTMQTEGKAQSLRSTFFTTSYFSKRFNSSSTFWRSAWRSRRPFQNIGFAPSSFMLALKPFMVPSP